MTRRSILEHAEALFNEKGIQPTSLADIAGAAGISKGTLFYHFRSKDDLIQAIAFDHIQRISAKVLALLPEESPGPNPEPEVLRRLLRRFYQEILEATLRNRFHLYLVEESLSRNPRLRETLQEKYREWQETMEEALTPYLPRQAATLAPLFIALADGLIIQEVLGRAHPPLEDLVDQILPCPPQS